MKICCKCAAYVTAPKRSQQKAPGTRGPGASLEPLKPKGCPAHRAYLHSKLPYSGQGLVSAVSRMSATNTIRDTSTIRVRPAFGAMCIRLALRSGWSGCRTRAWARTGAWARTRAVLALLLSIQRLCEADCTCGLIWTL